MRLAILQRTHNGADIYAYIVYVRTGVKAKLVPTRTCPVVLANPWDGARMSLVVRIRPTQGGYLAMHHDESGTLHDGNVWDFAAKHYGVIGAELDEAINNDLKLHCGEEYDVAAGVYVRSYTGLFTYYRSPIKNTIPYKDITLSDVYKVIKGQYFRKRTEELRRLSDDKARRQYKATMFDYCTFGGTFGERRAANLKELSGLMCLDFDHVKSVEELRGALLSDKTIALRLVFRSPSGDGLKAVIDAQCVSNEAEYGEYFDEVCRYMAERYGVEVDKSGRDVCRACFIPYDPEAVLIDN